jgi:hypothetical protein
MKTKSPNPAVTLGADLGEYLLREREIAAKARAGPATIEDYKSLGYTEAGARWMVDRPWPSPGPTNGTRGTTAGRAHRLYPTRCVGLVAIMLQGVFASELEPAEILGNGLQHL